MALFEMIQYHSYTYPDDIPLRIKEIPAHFDVAGIAIDGPCSLHTEYSYGKRALDSEVIEKSDVVFLAVKPIVVEKVLKEVKDSVLTHNPVLVSVVTGVSVAELEDTLGSKDVKIVRTMPNVNVEIGEGMTALHKNDNVSDEDYQLVRELFEKIGKVAEIEEKDFSTFVALAGSSPAFVYFFIDSLARSGVKYGLNKQKATQIAAQAVLGSALKVLKSDKTPWELVDDVSSPGGTTVAGLLAMEEAGFMTSIVKGVDATISKDKG